MMRSTCIHVCTEAQQHDVLQYCMHVLIAYAIQQGIMVSMPQLICFQIE